MSIVTCNKTGIITTLDDSLKLTYNMHHPLSNIATVKEQWASFNPKHLKAAHKALLAGSLINSLVSLKLSDKLHDAKEVYALNKALATTATARQLLENIQRIISNWDKLRELSPDAPKFKLDTFRACGLEQDKLAKEKFYPCLVAYITKLVPMGTADEKELIEKTVLATYSPNGKALTISLDEDINNQEEISPLEAAYNLIEDSVSKTISRMPLEAMTRKRNTMLNSIHKSSIITDDQKDNLKQALKKGNLGEKRAKKVHNLILAKAYSYSNHIETLATRNRLFEQAAYAILLEPAIIAKEGEGFDDFDFELNQPEGKDTLATAPTAPKLTLKERLALLKANKEKA